VFCATPLCKDVFFPGAHPCIQIFLEDGRYEKMSMLSLIIYTRMLTHYSTEICARLALLYAVFVQVLLEGQGCKAKIALDTIEVRRIVE
jgi:hypothetical protein